MESRGAELVREGWPLHAYAPHRARARCLSVKEKRSAAKLDSTRKLQQLWSLNANSALTIALMSQLWSLSLPPLRYRHLLAEGRRLRLAPARVHDRVVPLPVDARKVHRPVVLSWAPAVVQHPASQQGSASGCVQAAREPAVGYQVVPFTSVRLQAPGPMTGPWSLLDFSMGSPDFLYGPASSSALAQPPQRNEFSCQPAELPHLPRQEQSRRRPRMQGSLETQRLSSAAEACMQPGADGSSAP